MNKNLIAFCGYARTGKSTAAAALEEIGYVNVSFGDIIKRQLDQLVLENLGFSAFTENDVQKSKIRPVLEQWGEVNYDNIMDEMFDNLPEKAVNQRIVRAREAKEWKRRGGKIILIKREGFGPATKWEEERLEELDGLIDANLNNLEDEETFKDTVRWLVSNL